MKILLFSIIIVILVYLLIKLCLYVYRPFFLSKTFTTIEQMYKRVQIAAEKDISLAFEDLKEWRSGDRVVIGLYSEDEIMERINAAKAAKSHEEEVYDKFLRLKERFILNHDKLSESIIVYQRYLNVRLQQRQMAASAGAYATARAVSFDEARAVSKEIMTAFKEIKIVLDESERKLDILLT